ncbi:MAG: HEAT repeat domain-containing protein [Nitrospira sp.]|nr:HEAT repeat domain-containing protein [Nitrospira sp.]
MGIYPKLETLELEELIKSFQFPPPEGEMYAAGYYFEVAEHICQYGEKGVQFLKQQLSNPDVHRVRAALFALSGRVSNSDTVPLLLSYLNDPRPLVVAEAIEGLRHNGYKGAMEQVVSLVLHPSPYVVGAALRYIGTFDRDRVIPLLLEALKHPDSLIRENACDELGDLEVIEAIPALVPLLSDLHPHVRQAAQTALEDLERIQKESRGASLL